MKVTSRMRPISLTTPQVVYSAITVLVVLPIVLGFTFMNSIYAAYLDRFVVPGLEQRWGFHGEYVEERSDGSTYRLYVFKAVDADSPFGRAGVAAGEMPCGYYHGVSEFFDQLREERGPSTRVRLCRSPSFQQREVEIIVPPSNQGVAPDAEPFGRESPGHKPAR